MGKSGGGAATRALALLRERGVACTVYRYRHDAQAESFGSEAARQIPGSADRVCKTLLVECDGGEVVVVVVPVTSRVSLKAVARAAGARSARLADVDLAQRHSGYVVGGISPFAQTKPHRTFVDASVGGLDEVVVSAGKRGMSIGVRGEDLVRLTGATLAPVAVP